jgi:hypothetical protein
LAGQGLNRTHLPTGTARRTTTDKTNAGRGILAKDPRANGSLGIAISEAVEDAATHDDTKYSLGSVLNHVCMHQTVIGLEAQEQMKLAGEYPDVVIACHGGGSNFSGIALPFVRDKMNGHAIKAAVDEAKKADAEGRLNQENGQRSLPGGSGLPGRPYFFAAACFSRNSLIICSCVARGTGWYLANSMENSPLPCVAERRSVEYPNISESGTCAPAIR